MNSINSLGPYFEEFVHNTVLTGRFEERNLSMQTSDN